MSFSPRRLHITTAGLWALLLGANLAAQELPPCPKERAPSTTWVKLQGYGLVKSAMAPLTPDSGAHQGHPVIADTWRFPRDSQTGSPPTLLSVALGPAEMTSAQATGCRVKAGGRTWTLSLEATEPGGDSVFFAVGRLNSTFAAVVMLSPATTWSQATILTFLDHLKVDPRIE